MENIITEEPKITEREIRIYDEMKNKAKARNYWKKVKLLEEDSRKKGKKF